MPPSPPEPRAVAARRLGVEPAAAAAPPYLTLGYTGADATLGRRVESMHEEQKCTTACPNGVASDAAAAAASTMPPHSGSGGRRLPVPPPQVRRWCPRRRRHPVAVGERRPSGVEGAAGMEVAAF